jgi:protein AbiQ
MKKQRFHLYHIDMKYVRDLARVDDKVMSVSPQVGKESRPFVGVVVCNQKKYYTLIRNM